MRDLVPDTTHCDASRINANVKDAAALLLWGSNCQLFLSTIMPGATRPTIMLISVQDSPITLKQIAEQRAQDDQDAPKSSFNLRVLAAIIPRWTVQKVSNYRLDESLAVAAGLGLVLVLEIFGKSN